MTNASNLKPTALHSIRIESPCTASWAKMQGDDRVRHCGDCNKHVFNLSAMSEAEGAALLADNTDGELCVRFYQRPDGTVMTSDCGTSARAYTRRSLRKLPGVAGAALLAMSVGGASAQPAPVASMTAPAPARDTATMMMGAPMATVVVPVKIVPTRQVVVWMGKPSFERDKPVEAFKEPTPLPK